MKFATRWVGPWAFATMLGLASTASASATILRCSDQGIVHVGDSRNEVLSACNEPTAASQRVVYRTIRVKAYKRCKKKQRHCVRWVERIVAINIDEWTYDFGRNRFVQYLTFENGRLVSIENGGYSERE